VLKGPFLSYMNSGHLWQFFALYPTLGLENWPLSLVLIPEDGGEIFLRYFSWLYGFMFQKIYISPYGLVVRVPGCRPRVPGFDSQRYQFLRSSGSGTWSTQRREDKWGATWRKKQRLWSWKLRLTAPGVQARWPRDTHLSAKVGTKFRRPVAVAQSV
jgi:hypothetical protein